VTPSPCSSDLAKIFVPKKITDIDLSHFFANSGLPKETVQDIVDITAIQARDGFYKTMGAFIYALIKKAKNGESLDVSSARAAQRHRLELKQAKQPCPAPEKTEPVDVEAVHAKIADLERELANTTNRIYIKIIKMQIKSWQIKLMPQPKKAQGET